MDTSAMVTLGLPILTIAAGIVTSLITSQGLWNHISTKSRKDSAEADLLLGLGHTRIMNLCGKYIKRGWITPEEYEDLITYLYKPYLELGGNGTVKKMVENEINRLPIHHINMSLEQAEANRRCHMKENKS